MTARSPRDVVRAHLEAFSAHDLPAMLETMASDATFVTGTTLVAPQDFEEVFGWAMREIDPTVTITDLVADEERAACEFVESVTIDGERRQLSRAAFYTIRDDVICSAKVYDEREDLG
jgi:ketosteroid isomerase-like protein